MPNGVESLPMAAPLPTSEPPSAEHTEDQARSLMLDIGPSTNSPKAKSQSRTPRRSPRASPTLSQRLRTMIPEEKCRHARQGLPIVAAALVGCLVLGSFWQWCAAALTDSNVSESISLEREKKQQLGPGATPPRITILTSETRGQPLLSTMGDSFETDFGKIVNIGFNRTWSGFQTKIELLDEYLQAQLSLVGYDPPGEVERHLVVFVDGGDVFWGGCPLEEFRSMYHRIAEASGASVVFSAEVVCGEQDCNKVPAVPDWAGDMAGIANLSRGVWPKYAVGCRGTWNDECAAKRDCGYWAPCARPPSLKFLNSGFMIGPAKAMADMVSWARKNYEKLSVWGDQSVFASYWLEHQDRVTLDYTSELAISISDMDYKLLSVDHKSGDVRNMALDKVQCMIHGNGRGRDFLEYLVSQKTHKPFKAIRGF